MNIQLRVNDSLYRANRYHFRGVHKERGYVGSAPPSSLRSVNLVFKGKEKNLRPPSLWTDFVERPCTFTDRGLYFVRRFIHRTGRKITKIGPQMAKIPFLRYLVHLPLNIIYLPQSNDKNGIFEDWVNLKKYPCRHLILRLVKG